MKDGLKKILVTAVIVIIGGVLLWTSGIVEISSESVTVRNAGVKMAGTLATPRFESGPFPGVVIVHGSGRVRREDLRGFVRKLVPEGYAVLTFDKRGVGKSAGVFTNVTVSNSERRIPELAADVGAAVNLLAEHPSVDPSRIYMVGTSQAGWIMPIVTNQDETVRTFISISGPAVSVGRESFYSQLTGDDPGPYENLTEEEIAENFLNFGGPDGYDPMQDLQELRVPSLWLLGEKDQSVPTAATVSNIQLLDTLGIFDVRVVPNADHNLDDVDSGDRYDYWSDILSWLQQH